MAKVGFLYNHRVNHQVLHTAPVAFALSLLDRSIEVEVMASTERQLDTARRIGEAWPGHNVRFRLMELPPVSRCLHAAGICWHSKKRRVLERNCQYFARFDALVVPERTSARLRDCEGLEHLQLIQIPHGAGDGAVGYEARHKAFDLVLVAGEKCRRRLRQEVGIAADKVQVIGYPKFEALRPVPSRHLFPEARPTVLYNPHFNPELSSWPRWGQQVLDWFAEQSRYNLIFAPHVLLYHRPLRHRARPLRRYRGLPHMLLDTGSDRCVDMTYTRLADIYLGDVSSQVYEFVHQPRPAVFLNSLGIRGWHDDPSYRHWQLGTVVEDVTELGDALAGPLTRTLAARQRALVRETFQQDPQPASLRGARAIRNHLGRMRTQPTTRAALPAAARPAYQPARPSVAATIAHGSAAE